MRGHGPGQVHVQGKREQVCVEVVRFDARQGEVTVNTGAPMPRNVLADRLNPRCEQSARKGPTEAGDLLRFAGQRAVADDGVGTGNRKVQHGCCDDVEAGISTIQTYQCARQPGGAQADQSGRRRMQSPVWRPQPGDAPPLLIHHKNCARQQDSSQLCRQLAQLRRRLDIPGKQDNAGGRPCPEQRCFVGRELRAGYADDGGFQNSATVQPVPFARTRSQKSLA